MSYANAVRRERSARLRTIETFNSFAANHRASRVPDIVAGSRIDRSRALVNPTRVRTNLVANAADSAYERVLIFPALSLLERVACMPIRVSTRRFDALVERAMAGLPDEFRKASEVVRVEVRERPTPEQLASVGLSEEELLLGLYVGVPLTERSVGDSAVLPDVIYLFREDLEDATDSEGELAEEVRVTLLHELGHYFGFDEDDLERLGYA